MLGRELSEAQKFRMLEVVAHEMGLDIEDELPGQALRARLHQLGLVRLGRRDLEHVGSIDLIHGEESSGHAAARLHELPTAQAEPLAVNVRQLEDAPFDALLRLALPRRKILAVRNDLGRNRGCGRSRFGACDKTLFSFAEPTTHRRLPSSVRDKEA